MVLTSFHHAKCGGAQISHTTGEKFDSFLSVTLLNDKVCERYFAISALECSNDFGIVGYGSVCRFAHAFNFVSITLGGATAEWQS